jgi:hypothetical protein
MNLKTVKDSQNLLLGQDPKQFLQELDKFLTEDEKWNFMLKMSDYFDIAESLDENITDYAEHMGVSLYETGMLFLGIARNQLQNR